MSSKKPIVLNLISSLQMGGTEKLLIETLKQTKKSYSGMFVTIVINDCYDDKLKEELIQLGYPAYFLNKKIGQKSFNTVQSLIKIINKYNVNVMHTHNIGSKLWAILVKMAMPEIRLVYTLHTTNTWEKSNRIFNLLHKKFVDANIAISKSIFDEALEHGIENIVHIYNGIDLSKFPFNTTKSKNDKLNILNVSRLTSIKGQDILIKALNLCKQRGVNFSCTFVGGKCDYDQENYHNIMSLVDKYKLSDNIHFAGQKSDIVPYLNKADLFVLPSRFEGLGIAALEAMAAGVPVIASNIGGPREIIFNDFNGFLFERENYKELADKIVYFYKNNDRQVAMRQSAYDYVRDFDISIMCEKYLELYSLLAR